MTAIFALSREENNFEKNSANGTGSTLNLNFSNLLRSPFLMPFGIDVFSSQPRFKHT